VTGGRSSRAEVARQQTAYNQPSHTSFYLGSDIDWSNVPVPAGAWTGDRAAELRTH
jgi:hypothetical protein